MTLQNILRGTLVDEKGQYVRSKEGKVYRIEKGQVGGVINQVNRSGFGYLFERNRERAGARLVYPYWDIPVLFVPSGRSTRRGQPYATDLEFDKEAAVDELILEVLPSRK